MIYYPLQTLCRCRHPRDHDRHRRQQRRRFSQAPRQRPRVRPAKHIAYTYQEGEGGIADALKLCEHFAGGEPIVVILGDNIMQNGIGPYVALAEQPSGCRLLLKEVDGSAAVRRRRVRRRPDRRNRGEAAASEEPLRGHGHLHVRQPRVRDVAGSSRRRAASSRSPTSTTRTFVPATATMMCLKAGRRARNVREFTPCELDSRRRAAQTADSPLKLATIVLATLIVASLACVQAASESLLQGISSRASLARTLPHAFGVTIYSRLSAGGYAPSLLRRVAASVALNDSRFDDANKLIESLPPGVDRDDLSGQLLDARGQRG